MRSGPGSTAARRVDAVELALVHLPRLTPAQGRRFDARRARYGYPLQASTLIDRAQTENALEQQLTAFSKLAATVSTSYSASGVVLDDAKRSYAAMETELAASLAKVRCCRESGEPAYESSATFRALRLSRRAAGL